MNIFLVIPTIKQGGAERVISELANEWAIDHTVYLILLSRAPHFYSINPNVIIKELDFSNSNIADKIISQIQVLRQLRKLMKEIRPDFVLSFMEKYNILTILSSYFLNLKIFISDRSSPKKKIPFIIEVLRRVFYKRAEGIIAQTDLAKGILYNKTKHNNIEVIPNPVKAITKVNEKENIILNVGRMIPSKGQKELINVFHQTSNQDWKLVLLGDGPSKFELESYINQLGISDKVLLLGNISDVDFWYSKAKIFAFMSNSEGFPNSLAEAMAAGATVISYDCVAGPSDLITHDYNGYLVKLNDSKTYLSLLEELMKNEDNLRQMGKQAKESMKKFELKHIAERYLIFCSQA